MDTPAVHPALEKLHHLARQNPGLREAAQFYEHIIPAMREAERYVPALVMERGIVEEKLLAGTPLLVGELLEFDPQRTGQVMQEIYAAMRGAGVVCNGVDKKAADILAAASTGALDPLPLIIAVGRSETGPLEEAVAGLDLDVLLLALAVESTFKVFLRAWRGMVENQVDLDRWQRSTCPICGAEAALAEVHGVGEDGGVRGQRFLRCLRCAAGWPYPNLRCAFCGNEDYHSLGVLLLDEPVRRLSVHTCDRCHRYIKTIDTFDRIPADLLMVEDLATLPLDILAMERGYAK